MHTHTHTYLHKRARMYVSKTTAKYVINIKRPESVHFSGMKFDSNQSIVVKQMHVINNSLLITL